MIQIDKWKAYKFVEFYRSHDTDMENASCRNRHVVIAGMDENKNVVWLLLTQFYKQYYFNRSNIIL